MDKILEQVQALLARAEHPNTPEPERELCFERANKLITRHALDEAIIRSRQTAEERRRPVTEKFRWMEKASSFAPYLRTILSEICETNRCRAIIHPATYEVTVVGFKEDVSWVQMLYMNCYFTFLSKMFPKWNDELGYDENVYNFKIAGYKWPAINDTAVKHGHEDHSRSKWNYETHKYDYSIGGAVIAAYKRHAKKVGDTNRVQTQRHSAYRMSFAEAFARRVSSRLEQMREEAARMSESAPGMMLAIRNDVDDMFYELFPNMNPEEMERIRSERERAMREAQEREERERQEMLDAMTEKQRAAFLEKEERQRRREAASNERYWREYDRRNRIDSDGSRAGSSAADTVRLTRDAGIDSDEKKGIEG